MVAVQCFTKQLVLYFSEIKWTWTTLMLLYVLARVLNLSIKCLKCILGANKDEHG